MARGTTALLLLTLAAGPALGCGAGSDCPLGARAYRIRLADPTPGAARSGAILFAGGYGDTAASVMENAELGQAISALGLALIAVQPKRASWATPGSPFMTAARGQDDLAYVDRVVADVVARFPVDRRRLLASGFSAGGMLVWNLACHRADRFAGFAPISGTLWEPLPRDCAGRPAMLRHVHGTADPLVPIEGRAERQWRLGSVFAAVELFAASGGFGPPRAERADGLDCSVRQDARGNELSLCLHDGEHVLRAADVVTAWHVLSARPGF